MTLLLALFLSTQTIDHRDIIAAAKAQTIAAGINPDAPAADECARWEIVRRAIPLIPASEHAGMLAKPTGNNCQGFAVDIVAFPDGTIVDVLGSGSEGPNTPLWIVNPNKVDASRWRPAPDLPSPEPTPLPPPPLPSDQTDFAAISQKLDLILHQLDQLRQDQQQDTEKIQSQIDSVVKNAERSATPLLLKILSLGFAR